MKIANVYVLEVAKGSWKPKNTLPCFKTPHVLHGSCVVGDALYVVAGKTNEGFTSAIEMLEIRLKDDLLSELTSKSWN